MRIPTRWWIPAAALLGGLVLGYALRGAPEGPAAMPAGQGAGKYYVCEKHGHIHEGPGTCPVCGEPLKPADVMQPKRGPKEERKVKYWRSPMDPTFVSRQPGKDNMGMDLVPVYEGEARAEAGMVVVEPEVVQTMGIRTAVLEKGPLVRRIRTVGNIAYDEETLGTVTTRLAGWVEKLYVDQTGQAVEVGDPLFEFYSKELEAAQSAFLDSLRDPRLKAAGVSPDERERAQGLLESARRRLQSWDIPEDQIEAIAKDGRVHRTVTMRSAFRGVVTHKKAVAGRFFAEGAPLYEIADLATVWVYAKIYEYERPWVKVGQKASISLSYVPGRTLEGTVDFVYPYLNEKTRDITVRMRFPNADGTLLPGMFANVTMDCSLGTEALLVPEDAVLDTGVRKIVFVVRGPGQFEGRDVRLGVRTGAGTWEVLDGLKEGDRIVLSGQFLLDAESMVREAIRKFLDVEGGAAAGKGGGNGGMKRD